MDSSISDLPVSVPDLARRFSGVARVYGEPAAAAFARARVVVVGIGGVGSWAAEALARCAVGAIALVDMDHVAESNTNRQIHALGDAYGRAKVEAMAERIVAINPACRVEPIDAFADEENAARLVAEATVVIDCIDDVAAKVALVLAARAGGVPLIVCGAAGGRTDPTRITCEDLALVVGDRLLARVRHQLRRRHGYPAAHERRHRFQVPAVYSDEPLHRSGATASGAGAPLGCAGYGSSVAVTATMGFVAAARALQALMTAGADRAP